MLDFLMSYLLYVIRSVNDESAKISWLMSVSSKSSSSSSSSSKTIAGGDVTSTGLNWTSDRRGVSTSKIRRVRRPDGDLWRSERLFLLIASSCGGCSCRKKNIRENVARRRSGGSTSFSPFDRECWLRTKKRRREPKHRLRSEEPWSKMRPTSVGYPRLLWCKNPDATGFIWPPCSEDRGSPRTRL